MSSVTSIQQLNNQTNQPIKQGKLEQRDVKELDTEEAPPSALKMVMDVAIVVTSIALLIFGIVLGFGLGASFFIPDSLTAILIAKMGFPLAVVTTIGSIGLGALGMIYIGKQAKKEARINYSYRSLEKFPEEILDNPKLRELDLSKNKIKTIPKEINTLVALEKLELSENKLDKLPNEICELKNLKDLRLYENELTELPTNFKQLLTLEILDLSKNKFSVFPKQIYDLKNLSFLQFSQNPQAASKMTDEIANLKNLKALTLNDNQLENLPEFLGLAALRNLYISKNKFKTFPKSLCSLTNLENLWMSDNKLSQFPTEIGQLQNLRRFNLTNNNISELPKEIVQLKNLRFLHVAWNNISKMPDEIEKLENLTSINIAGNPFTTSLDWILKLPKLYSLTISSEQQKMLPQALDRTKVSVLVDDIDPRKPPLRRYI